jgi:hypothetical protein
MKNERAFGAAEDSTPLPHLEMVDADTFWQSSSRRLVPPSEGFFRASLRWLDETAPGRGRGV